MLILTDLDDTLFQTFRKCPPDGGNLVAKSYLADGSESGFATERQQRFLSWMGHGQIVPVTARSREVLNRVTIQQAPAICANGGCVIDPDGEVDAKWHAILEERAASSESVRAVFDRISAELDTVTFRHWIVAEGSLDLYIVIKDNIENGAKLDALHPEIAKLVPKGWRTHRNGNNLAFLPCWLNKREAARYLIEEAKKKDPHIPVVGIGDSHSDAGFMDLCDYAMAPTNSQLWKHFIEENEWC